MIEFVVLSSVRQTSGFMSRTRYKKSKRVHKRFNKNN
jgi:hypothetical protein